MLTEDGRDFRPVAGTIRNDGSGWELLTNSGHQPTGLSHVVEGTDRITVYFSFTASFVTSLVVCPDETFAKAGYRVGASVGLDRAVILIYNDAGQVVAPASLVSTSGNFWIHGLMEVTA